jgi:hypothetical protein
MAAPELRISQKADKTVRMTALGHEPPRLQRANAAERPLIADMMADDWAAVTGQKETSRPDNRIAFREQLASP